MPWQMEIPSWGDDGGNTFPLDDKLPSRKHHRDASKADTKSVFKPVEIAAAGSDGKKGKKKKKKVKKGKPAPILPHHELADIDTGAGADDSGDSESLHVTAKQIKNATEEELPDLLQHAHLSKRAKRRKLKACRARAEKAALQEVVFSKEKKKRSHTDDDIDQEMVPPPDDDSARVTHKKKKKKSRVNHNASPGLGLGALSIKDKKPDASSQKALSAAAISNIASYADVESAAVSKEVAPSRRRTKGMSAAERLMGARFRMLNEKLYTSTGEESYVLFEENPSLFDVYHAGFQSQVNRWPVNPVDSMIAYLQKLSPTLKVADFGCGEAKIAKSVENKVYSFDLVAANDHVTACDMRNVPLEKQSVHVAIFCLSLMGTNYLDYLKEAWRVLKMGGTLKIAEVKSRIADTDEFIEFVEATGFEFVSQNASNVMFIDLEFQKCKRAGHVSHADAVELLPCIYKKR